MQADSSNLIPKKRRRKWPAVLLLLALPLIGSLVAYSYYTQPERIRKRVEGVLRERVDESVHVGSATFHWSEGLNLKDVSLSAEPAKEMLRIPSVELRTTGWRLLFGKTPLDAVVVAGGEFNVVRDSISGGLNVEHFWNQAQKNKATPSKVLPTIEVRDATLRLTEQKPDGERIVEQLRLNVRGRIADDSKAYELVWEVGASTPETGRIRIPLSKEAGGSFRGSLPWLSTETLAMVADTFSKGALAASAGIELHGRARIADWTYQPSANGSFDGSATLELRNASLSVPMDETERTISASQRYFRFEGVGATLVLRPDRINCDLRGVFHGAPLNASAVLLGRLGTDSQFEEWGVEGSVAVRNFTLPSGDSARPEERRAIDRWPPVAEIYSRYDPHGPVDIEAHVRKEPDGAAPLRLESFQLDARGGDGSSRFFPYRVSNLTGSIRIGPQGLVIESLCGDHADAQVCVSAFAETLKRNAAAQVHITGHGLLIDDALWRGIPPTYGEFRRLFDPQGRVNVAVDMIRERGSGDQRAPWRTEYLVGFDHVAARYLHVPYPIDDITGQFTVDRDRILDIHLSGLAGQTPLHADGRSSVGAGGDSDLDLQVSSEDLPLDRALVNVLPERARDLFAQVHTTGRVNVRADLHRDQESKRIRHSTAIDLSDVTVRHETLPMNIDSIHGRLQFDDAGIRGEGIRACMNGGDLIIEGGLTFSDESFEIAVDARNLLWDAALSSCLPETIREKTEDWTIDGPLTAKLHLQFDPSSAQDGPWHGEAWVQFDGSSSLSHRHLPLPLRAVQGILAVQRSGMRIDDLVARYGTAMVTAEWESTHSEQETGHVLKLTADGLSLDESIRDILPMRARATWDRLRPNGRIDLRLDELDSSRSTGASSAKGSWSGAVLLHEVGFERELHVQETQGRIEFSGRTLDENGGLSASGLLDFPTLELFGQPLQATTGAWSFVQLADGSEALSIQSIEGRLHEGWFTGELDVQTASGTPAYNLAVTLFRIPLEPLVNSVSGRRRNQEEPLDLGGVVDAQFRVSGTVGDLSSRRGMGRISVTEARVYRTPLLLAILNVLNLTLPSDEAFDEVRASFFVMGSRIQLTEVELRGKGLVLVGSGTMSWPDQNVDLHLYQVSPHWWYKVPVVTDLVDAAVRGLVELQVIGPLSHPEVKAKPLKGLTDELKSLWRKKKPSKIQPADR